MRSNACDGSVPLETREFPWDGTKNLKFSGSAELHFRAADHWRLQIQGSPNLLDELVVGGGRIGFKPGASVVHVGRLHIELLGPALEQVALDGSTTALLEGLNQSSLVLEIRGSSIVHGKGSVHQVSVNLMGSGSADLTDVSAATARVSVLGSGSADLSPSDAVSVTISGSGNVRLHTHPAKVDSSITGSGKVILVGHP
jgi:hypothetical protein